MKLKLTACIDASKESVWEILSDVTGINRWIAPISAAECRGDQQRGAGTVRICELGGRMKVEEEFTDWIEGRSFTYCARNIPMVKLATNRWSVEPVNGKTLVTTESEVVLKGGMPGKLLAPLLHMWAKKTGAESLSALKYLVENGRAYEGKHSKLPKALATC